MSSPYRHMAVLGFGTEWEKIATSEVVKASPGSRSSGAGIYTRWKKGSHPQACHGLACQGVKVKEKKGCPNELPICGHTKVWYGMGGNNKGQVVQIYIYMYIHMHRPNFPCQGYTGGLHSNRHLKDLKRDDTRSYALWTTQCKPFYCLDKITAHSTHPSSLYQNYNRIIITYQFTLSRGKCSMGCRITGMMCRSARALYFYRFLVPFIYFLYWWIFATS